jgi:hypothetical protein
MRFQYASSMQARKRSHAFRMWLHCVSWPVAAPVQRWQTARLLFSDGLFSDASGELALNLCAVVVHAAELQFRWEIGPCTALKSGTRS